MSDIFMYLGWRLSEKADCSHKTLGTASLFLLFSCCCCLCSILKATQTNNVWRKNIVANCDSSIEVFVYQMFDRCFALFSIHPNNSTVKFLLCKTVPITLHATPHK